MLIDGADLSATAKPDVQLIKLLIMARASTPHSSAATACRLPHWPSEKASAHPYFTRLVRLSYVAPDITQAIQDGRQPCS